VLLRGIAQSGSAPALGAGVDSPKQTCYSRAMKVCNLCKEEKEDSDFPPRKGKGLTSYCWVCKREYDRQYWQKTRERRVHRKSVNQANLRDRNTQYVLDYLISRSCEKCGEADPVVLQFHHRDPEQKSASIADLMSGSIASLSAEMEKCAVLCANCHIKHTAKTSGFRRAFLLGE
jgi:hypothetical protein